MTETQKAYNMVKSAKNYCLYMNYKNWNESIGDIFSEAGEDIIKEARFCKEYINYNDAYEYSNKWSEFSYYIDSLRRKIVDEIYALVR